MWTGGRRSRAKPKDPATLGYSLDWIAFADAWRGEYQPGMEEVRSGKIPFSKLDVLHRRNLETASCRASDSQNLSDEVLADFIGALGTASMPGRTSPGALARLKHKFLLAPVSNGNISLMVDLARRNDIPWIILGSEVAGDYKPKPRVYLAACEALDLDPANA